MVRKYLDDRYITVYQHKGYDICTLSETSKKEEYGYKINDVRYASNIYTDIIDAIHALDKSEDMTETEKIIKTLYEDTTFPLAWANRVKNALESDDLADEHGLFWARWIPVDIELPDEPATEITEDNVKAAILEGIISNYIVTIKDAKEPTALYYLGNGLWWDDAVNQICNVIAWMHMPRIYNENGR